MNAPHRDNRVDIHGSLLEGAVETGKVEFAMLIEAQKQILKVRQQQLQTQTDMQLRLADIEKLLGEEL